MIMTSRFGTLFRKLLPAVALVTAITCDNLDNIDVDAGGQVTVPAGTIVDKLLSGALDFAGFDKIDFSQDFANQGVSKDDVDSVRLKTITLTIKSGSNFDFLQSISFSVEADGQPSVEIAHLDAVPKGVKTIDLDVDANAELKPFVVAPSLRITGKAEGQRPDQETTISASAVFDVDIHIPGCK
jgi:hypothetical protein